MIGSPHLFRNSSDVAARAVNQVQAFFTEECRERVGTADRVGFRDWMVALRK
jgi:hypothetical protein